MQFRLLKRRNLIISLLGGAASWPLTTRAQHPTLPIIGFLHFGFSDRFAFQAAAFAEGLKDVGYVDGQNVAMEYRWAEDRYDRLASLAADLVSRTPDLIAAFGPPCARAAKNATATIPIVFTIGSDPVQDGLVPSLARPGGNITGISMLAVQLVPKRLELLSELIPRARTFAMLANPNNGYSDTMIRDVERAASAKGMQLNVLKAGTEIEIDAAFANLGNLHADGLVIGDDPFFTARREQIVALASRYSIPATYQFREFAVAGGLASYGPSLKTATHDSGTYAGRILKGAKPSDLPVAQPTRFELVINVKTAKALGVEVPQTLIARADEVIE
jgi:putative tryptophan/tyrosine transport system substrate-binding protein